MPTELKSSSLAEGQPEKKTTGRRKSGEFEREVNKQPHNTYTLASLRAKILEVMANMDREFVIHYYKKFWSRIEAVVDASGDFKK